MKTLRRSILRIVPGVHRANAVCAGEYLRWVDVGALLTDAERKLFLQPLARAELGRFIIRVYRDSLFMWRDRGSGRVSNKPLVLSISDAPAGGSGGGAAGGDGSGWTTIMGLPVLTSQDEETESNFREAFTQAAVTAKALYMLDSFDQSSMLIRTSDVPAFFRALDPSAA